uniref:Polycystin cation channel PKD1/PKD2 domain-containing protein n=1 Tax=Chromera velia CCMP2878 TaxID=1169474 RepID=A0A0G4I9X1_9ALVE|eukprot:Cvel_12378.t1-p1 / transcript=Cvel_12378.t1 / gene=Cvel_12378 / organism=Chromera_velia_CCMP2878 / gene_product=Polycystic kidney disease 2-like 1 protein, putative / transcript_product=Polycystic kidney disease 2-like 1 protein, putative / location=Cvel_scaffold808:36500-46582(+) / protein_length=717 / sequence_SO=supercontig / SO=protein_coding / is_pseudo=false
MAAARSNANATAALSGTAGASRAQGGSSAYAGPHSAVHSMQPPRSVRQGSVAGSDQGSVARGSNRGGGGMRRSSSGFVEYKRPEDHMRDDVRKLKQLSRYLTHDGFGEEERKGDVVPIGGVIGAVKTAKRDVLLRELILYTIFLAIFITITSMIRPVHPTFEIQDAMIGGFLRTSTGGSNFRKTFMDMTTFSDWHEWLENVFFERAFQDSWYNNEAFEGTLLPNTPGEEVNGTEYAANFTEGTQYWVMRYNRMISAIRIRQARVKDDSCATPTGNHELSRPCWGYFSVSTQNKTSQMAPSSEILPNGTDSPFFAGYAGSLSEFEGNFDNGGRYGTTGHIVDIPLNRTRAWEIIQAIRIASCRLFPYSRWLDLLRGGLELLFACFLIYYIVQMIMNACRVGPSFLWSFWNLVELGNIIAYLIIIAYWVLYVIRFGSERGRLRSFTPNQFVDLWTLTSVFVLASNAAAANIVWSFVRFFKHLQLYSRFLLIWDVLGHSMKHILPFICVTALIAGAFAFAGTWLFGARVREFHTITSAFSYLLRSIIDGLDYSVIKEASPYTAPVFAIAWVGIVTLILINMFIAILSDSYAFVQNRTRKMDELESAHADAAPGWSETLVTQTKGIRKALDRVDVERFWQGIQHGLQRLSAEDARESQLGPLDELSRIEDSLVDLEQYVECIYAGVQQQESGPGGGLREEEVGADSPIPRRPQGPSVVIHE